MPNDQIKINDLMINTALGKPINFPGKHSGKTLSGINLDFTVRGDVNIITIEDLFTNETVQVIDPFVNRSYEASLRMTSFNYQEGQSNRHYTAEIRELDMTPQFHILEIDGHQFDVIKYIETDDDNNEIGRQALLRLTKEQFVKLRDVIKPGTIQIKRLGVDDIPLTVRYGGAMYWSEHKDDYSTYYKHIVRFYPPESISTGHILAEGAVQEALTLIVTRLSVRFEALVNELSANQLLSNEQRGRLLGDDWGSLLDGNRIQDIILQVKKVSDAEDEL